MRKTDNKAELNQDTKDRAYDPIITFAEAGRQIGKPRETIRRWVNDGLIPFVKHPSGLPGIRQSDFDRIYSAAKVNQQT